ncbi:MAG TPA: tetratricopeptide repeat protein, partial [Niastella sp.]
DFVFALYCYNADGVNGNNLYGFLTFWQAYNRRSFSLLEKEKTFLTKCCWVLGMIGSGNEMLIFVADPLGTVRAIHFAELLQNISEEAFDQAVQTVLDAKSSLKAFMSSETYLTMAEEPINTREEEDENEEDDSAAEEAETLAFLEKHNIKAVTYEEILAALNVENLFDYWEEDADNDMANNYESERDYYDNFSGSFFYCDGDLTIDGDLAIPHKHVRLIAVRGNMTINGKVSEDNGYYVTGNTTVDYLGLGEFQKTLGHETVRFVASAWGQDDEMTHTMSFRKINAPYFFSWFYDLDCFEFAPNTLITVLYDYDRLSAYETENTILIWHEYAYAFNPNLYYQVEESHYDVLNLGTHSFYETLKAGKPVLREGVTAEAIQLTRKGVRLNKEGDAAGAYQCFKDAIAKGPGYYLAYYYAGKCLFDKKAYAQAKELYAKGIPLTPEKLLYEIGCFEQAALCAVRIGEYDQAIEWAKAAVQKRPSAAFCIRIIGEALIFQNKPDEAKQYLEQS